MKNTIYLDNNATTALAPEVKQVLIECMEVIGNPFSPHKEGQIAKNWLLKSKRTLSDALRVRPQELTFTSGATESLNTLLQHYVKTGGKILTSSIEHQALYKPLKTLEEKNYPVEFLSPENEGPITVEQVEKALKNPTSCVMIMAVNNETGVINEWEEIASLCLKKGIPYVVDGVALLGREHFNIPEGVTAMTFSAHKVHGPKGIGLTYVRRGEKISPLILGGSQEDNQRAGTENLLGIAGFAKAVELLQQDPKIPEKLAHIKNTFENKLLKKGMVINGKGPRVSNTSNIAFSDVDAETLLINLDLNGIYASHGSACSSGAMEPSRILLNMGLSYERARSSLRFSFSRYNTLEEVDIITTHIHQMLQRDINCASNTGK